MNKKRKKKKKKGQKRARPNLPRSSSQKMTSQQRDQPTVPRLSSQKIRNQRLLEPTRHVYPDGWEADDWLVPYDEDGVAHFRRTHGQSNDHGSCGPQIFWCAKAMSLLVDHYPSWDNPQVHWDMTEGSHLVTWISEDGPRTFYFFFCAPDERNVLLCVGISRSEARDVLLKRVPLDDYLDQVVAVNY